MGENRGVDFENLKDLYKNYFLMVSYFLIFML